MMDDSLNAGKPRNSGLLSSLQALFTSCLGVLQTRLEILVVEFEEEKLRIGKILVLGFLALFFLCFGFALLSALVIAFFWDSHRLTVMAIMVVFYLLLGFIAIGCLRRSVKNYRPFATTLSELARDKTELGS